MRYLTEFRSSKSAFNLRFMDTQIRQSELFYFSAGEGASYRNCIGKELTVERIIERLS
jgi:hypothetical protein